MTEIRTRTDKVDEVEAAILEILDTFADEHGYPFDVRRVAIEAHEDGRMIGGFTGEIMQGWLFIDLLAVRAEARGTGLGRRLIAEAEAFARAEGLTGIHLNTFSFQAPGFYEALGFDRIGEIPDHPPGERRIFYAKRIDGGT